MMTYSIKEKVVLIIVSIFLSRFLSVYIAPYISSVNFSDILLLLFLIIVSGKKNIVEWRRVFALVRNPGFLFFLFIFLFLFVVGLINYFDIKSSVGELRYHIYVLLSFIIVFKGIVKDKYKLLWIVVITLIIDLLITIDQRNFAENVLDPRVSFSPYIIFVSLYMLALFKKTKLLLIMSFVGIGVSLYGGFRAGAVVAIVSLVLYLAIILFFDKSERFKNKIKVYLVIFVLFFLVFFVGEKIIEFITSDKVLNHYIINRTESFFTGLFDPSSRGVVFEQDYGRLEPFLEIYRDPLYFSLPHGFGVWGAFEDGFGLNNSTRMNTLDNGYFYIAFHYGLVMGIVMISLFLCSFIDSILREGNSYYRKIKFLSVLILLGLMAINAPLQGFGSSVFMGIYLADLLKNSKIIKILFRVKPL